MPLLLQSVNLDTDFNELFAVEWAAWTSPPQPEWELLCPVDNTSEATRTASIEHHKVMHLHKLGMSPESQWLKVIDSETGAIVAGALYKIYKTNPYRAPEEDFQAVWWPEGGDMRQLIERCNKTLSGNRVRIMSEAHVYLNNVFTHPSHRRRGAAAILVEWGVKKADEMGVEAYCEGGLLGKRVYERFGYVHVGTVKFDLEIENPTEKWKEYAQRIEAGAPAIMWRPIGGKYDKGKTVLPWTGKTEDVDLPL